MKKKSILKILSLVFVVVFVAAAISCCCISKAAAAPIEDSVKNEHGRCPQGDKPAESTRQHQEEKCCLIPLKALKETKAASLKEVSFDSFQPRITHPIDFSYRTFQLHLLHAGISDFDERVPIYIKNCVYRL